MSRKNVGWCIGLNIDIRQNIWPTEAPHLADEPQNRFYFLRIRLVTNSWPISSAKSTRKEKQKIPLLESHRKASKKMFFLERSSLSQDPPVQILIADLSFGFLVATEGVVSSCWQKLPILSFTSFGRIIIDFLLVNFVYNREAFKNSMAILLCFKRHFLEFWVVRAAVI